MHISLAQYLVIASIVIVGSIAQGTIGFGLSLIAAPVIGLVEPSLMPAASVLLGAPLSLAIAWREFTGIDWQGVRRILVARVPGSAVGGIVVSVVSTRALGGIIGAAVLVACAIAAQTSHHTINRANTAVAGVFSGFMDTASGTGGPPLALLYQHRPTAEIRPTLATSFLIGMVISITSLSIGGNVAWWQVAVAFSLTPALAVGFVLSRLLHSRLANVSLRPVILTFAAAAGAATLIRAIVG